MPLPRPCSFLLPNVIDKKLFDELMSLELPPEGSQDLGKLGQLLKGLVSDNEIRATISRFRAIQEHLSRFGKHQVLEKTEDWASDDTAELLGIPDLLAIKDPSERELARRKAWSASYIARQAAIQQLRSGGMPVVPAHTIPHVLQKLMPANAS